MIVLGSHVTGTAYFSDSWGSQRLVTVNYADGNTPELPVYWDEYSSNYGFCCGKL